MKLKKQKNIKNMLKKIGYKIPYKILVSVDFLKTFNKQKFKLSFFNSLTFKNPKIYVTECTYKQYKGEHKKTNKEKIKGMNNVEKKKWKKTRFVDDFIRHCTIKKCSEKEEYKDCICRFLKKSSNKYFLACEEKESIETKRPMIHIKCGELKIVYDDENEQKLEKIQKDTTM
ncbi:hypothetical protein BDAP_001092 [Binucleata daphniae]